MAFGTDSGCLQDPDNSEFLKEAKNSFQVRYVDKVAGHLLFYFSGLMKMFNIKTFNPSFEKFLRRLFDEVMTSRMKNGGNRNDLIDALIALKKAEMGKEKIVFSKDVLVSQVILEEISPEMNLKFLLFSTEKGGSIFLRWFRNFLINIGILFLFDCKASKNDNRS